MTSIGKSLGFGLVILAASQVSTSAATPARHHAKPATQHHKAAPKPAALAAPAYIRDRIDTLGNAFDGRVGIAVKSVDEGWETGWRDKELFPQQSVSKLWVSITALDAVDRRRLDLNDRVTLTKADLTVGALKVSKAEARDFGVMQVDTENRIIGFEEKKQNPKTIPGDDEHCLASMGIYVFTAKFMFEQLCRDATVVDTSDRTVDEIVDDIIGRLP